MVRVIKEDYMALERMIERYGLQRLLEILAFICGAMAKQARESWRDENLAQTWDKDAAAIDKLRGEVSG
jgi:glutathione peroxidase-family protein